MKIAYVTTYDATDVGVFGGCGYYIAQALKNQSMSLEYIGPLRQKYLYKPLFKVKEYSYKLIQKRRYTRSRDRILLRDYALQISRRLSGLDVDIVFSPITPGSQPIAYLDCDQPIVIWTDATLAGVIGFYPSFSNLCKETIRDGIANERSALTKCSLAIYSSEWAAQTAIEHYQLDPCKVKVVPFGPYLECDKEFDDVRRIVDARSSDECKLLFCGRDWHRKGGDLAFQVAKELNKSGLPTVLTVVGCQPSIDEPLPDFVRSLGYINKATGRGLDELNRELADSHFLILPTRADSAPAVFREAGCFGLPCITTNVGGIPTVVRDDVNGKTFSKDASPVEYCKYICDVFLDYPRYKCLALSSFNEYRARLNWLVAGQAIKELLLDLIS
jgi:glycosyltransferase involved in cell wall biosynthesis